MDQISRLVFDVVGRDRGGSKVLNDAATASDRAHTGFSKLQGSLSNLGGPFGQVTMLAGNLGDALDANLGKVQKFGLATTALGVGLIAASAKEMQARRQLQQAIENTGAAESDYRSQIDATIKAQERNAHTADDTQNALNTLVTANQDVTKSLSEMNFVADIAASKHESLAEAATQLVQAEAGNTRAFKSFGIVLDGVGSKSGQIDRALKQLQDRLSGQASASVDTFAGRLKVIETRIEDNIAALGKYGPLVTAVGVGLTVYASVLQLKAARQLADAASTAAETRAEIANAAARERTAAAADLEAAAIQRVTVAQTEGAVLGNGMAMGLGPGLATRAIGGKLLRAGGYALAGQAVGGIVGGTTGSIIGSAGYGAALGSFAGPEGTIAGALVGGAIGAVSHYFGGGTDPNYQANLNATAATEKGYQKLQADLARYQATAKQTSGPVHDLAEKQIAATKTALDAGQAAHEYATSLLKEKQAADAAQFSLKGEIKTLLEATGKSIGLSSAQDDLQASMHAMAQAAHDGGTALHGHTLAAEANRNAIRDSVSKMLALIQAEKDAGVSGGKVRQSAIDMAKALEHNATEIYGNKTAVDKLLQSLGVMPHQIANALTSLDSLAPQMGSFFTNLAHDAFGWGQNVGAEFEAGWQTGVNGQGTGTSSPFADPGHPGYQSPAVSKSAKDYGKNVAKAVVSGYAPAIDSGVSAATSKAMDQAKKMADLEKQTADQVRQTFRQIRDQIAGTFNVASLPGLSDSFGSPMGAADPRKSAHQYVQQLEHWARLLGRLRKQGLNRVMLDQFEQAGVAAIPAMEEILRQHEIPSLNASERRIQRVGRSVAAIDIQHTEGKQLEHVLQRLPHRLAHELAKELHHMNISVSLKETARHRGRRVRNKS